ERVLISALVLGYGTGSEATKAAGAMILGGPYTAMFWGLVVVAGLVAPLILNLVELKRNIPGTRFAPVLILVGGLVLRVVFVAAGQLVSYSHLG
ncbi:MAG: polysulfide reductase NrfD, partial [Anaerolineales bacterium]|nr:polysulfide reductase NrfD [Anaerolineales bacterium]